MQGKRLMAKRFAIATAMLVSLSPMGWAQDVTNDIFFEADNITMTEENYNVVATGSVKLSNDDMKLNADQVVVVFEEPSNGDAGDLEFSYATAQGNVWGESQGIEITSNAARYDESTQSAVFSGNVVVTQNGSQVRAQEARIDTRTGTYELIGRVKGQIRGSF